jgi:hypothetical protein
MEGGEGNGKIIIRISGIQAMRKAGNCGEETSDTIMAAALLLTYLFVFYFVGFPLMGLTQLLHFYRTSSNRVRNMNCSDGKERQWPI